MSYSTIQIAILFSRNVLDMQTGKTIKMQIFRFFKASFLFLETEYMYIPLHYITFARQKLSTCKSFISVLVRFTFVYDKKIQMNYLTLKKKQTLTSPSPVIARHFAYDISLNNNNHLYTI